MNRVVSPFGVRTALATGLVMLSLTPSAALASSRACSGAISVPDSARRGTGFTVTATAVQGEHFEIFLAGGGGTSFLKSGDVTGNGNFPVTVTVPVNFPTGGATVVMDMASPSTCDYGSGITILPKITIVPGVTITINPALTTTTAAPPTTTTTTAAPQSTSATTTSSTTTTVAVSTSTSTEGFAGTATSVGTETTIPDSTSTSLIAAAPPATSGGGQPWSAWITGGLAGLMLGAAGMLAAIRKGVLKI